MPDQRRFLSDACEALRRDAPIRRFILGYCFFWTVSALSFYTAVFAADQVLPPMGVLDLMAWQAAILAVSATCLVFAMVCVGFAAYRMGEPTQGQMRFLLGVARVDATCANRVALRLTQDGYAQNPAVWRLRAALAPDDDRLEEIAFARKQSGLYAVLNLDSVARGDNSSTYTASRSLCAALVGESANTSFEQANERRHATLP